MFNIEDDNPLVPVLNLLQANQQRITDLEAEDKSLTDKVQALTITPRQQLIKDLLASGKSWGFLNIPYVFGAEYDSNKAFDCSSFTQKLYACYNINLPRTSYEQFAIGTPVDWNSVQPGDLLFYKFGVSTHPTTHVGISYSPGWMLHTNHPNTSIHLQDVTTGGWFGAFVGAKRVIA